MSTLAPMTAATPGREELRQQIADMISAGVEDGLSPDEVAGNVLLMFELAAKPADEGLYLVWSNQHRCWWRPNSHGYTGDVREAGRYSRAEAISISFQGRDGWQNPKGVPDEIAIAESDVPAFAPSTTEEPKP